MKKNEILLNLIEHYTGGNKRQFAQMLGVSPQSVSAWIKRDTFDVDILSTKCSGINPSYLLTGEGDMLLTGDGKTGEESKTEGNQVSMDAYVLDRILTALDKIVEQGARNQEQFDKVLEQSAKIQEQSAKNQEQFDKVLSLFDRLLTQQERGADNNPSVCSI